MTSAARSARRVLPTLLALLPLALVGCGGGASEGSPAATTARASWQLEGSVMGTTWHARGSFRHDGTAESVDLAQVLRAIRQAVEGVDARMSTYQAESELSRFNRAPAGAAFAVSADTALVVETALGLAATSGGAFDPTVMPLVDLWGFGPAGRELEAPTAEALAAARAEVGWQKLSVTTTASGEPALLKTVDGLEVDLSAIAKGYGVDAACDALEQLGLVDYLVEVGGELRCHGQAPSGEPWRIGIDAPGDMSRPGEALAEVLEPGDAAVATSGDYRNFRRVDGHRISHTIDPRSGHPVDHGLASVSILAPTCMLADALATTCMVLGADDALELVAAFPDTEALLIVHDGQSFTVRRSPGWPVRAAQGN